MSQKVWLVIGICVSIIVLAACTPATSAPSAPTAAPTNALAPASTSTPQANETVAASPTATSVVSAPALSPTGTAVTSGSSASSSSVAASPSPTRIVAPTVAPVLAKSFKGFRLPDGDPCKLLAQADVERALGKPIKSASGANDQNTGAKSCFYLNDPGKSFVLVTYLQGDDAKLQLLGSIAQLQQKGCSSFSGGGTTRRVTPTPLPPAVDALKPKSLVELFGIHAQLSKEKCPPGSRDLSGLGEGASMDPVLGTAHIVAGEVYLVFFLADSDLTEQKRIEGVRLLAASLFK